MAWPIDALYQTFAAKNQVTSAFLNDQQQRVVDLHAPRIVPITRYCIKEYTDGSGHTTMEWNWDTDAPEHGASCVNAGGVVVIPIPIPDGCNLDTVLLKVKNDGVPSLVADLHEIDHKIESATTTPTIGASLVGDAAAGAGAWDTLELALDQEMDSYKQIVCLVTAASAGDLLSACYAMYQPITPTP